MKQEKGKQTYSSHAAHMPILLRCRFRPLGTKQLVSFIGFNHHDACTGATACFGSRKTTSGKSRHNIFEINFSLKYGTRRIDRVAQSGSRFGLRGHCLEVFIQSANFVSNHWSRKWYLWSCQVSSKSLIFFGAKIQTFLFRYFYDYDDCDFPFDSKKEKYGILQYKLPGNPFMVNGDKESATIGKNFLIRLFTKMYCLGYDFVTASDLTRTIDMVNLHTF